VKIAIKILIARSILHRLFYILYW